MTEQIKVEMIQDGNFLAKEFFSQQWQLYQKVLKNNYMGHREIYHVLHELLVKHWQKPFTMLELGCGDASFTTQALLNTQIAEYTGIDVSVPALENANKNSVVNGCQGNFITGDCWQLTKELAQDEQQKFDVVFTSFALHHLQVEEKEDVIKNVQNLLKPGGFFILIDVVRQENEDRDSYVQRYLGNVKKDWSLITPEEYKMMDNHISSSDFPETQSKLKNISQKVGFRDFECVYRDDLDTTQLLCFYR
ncbi:methyltransferase domain-containing protein [Sphaerospermopsis aphanizomenoides BCCUSP55]|uniref:class I SAM-dependent methyltransferase n=1 Tax=Sphaerospermopsis aphanizomenoides TaxID=459663 RepID=UPI001904F7DC|nr:L-histidine N(alpha)-methyltransferase [Sphaerospermopsis aphanizomenoides]MBK1989964.1 methyltransferase domain-containing protein [Sphaerospermopsis aphanizomenoides BCCUSP55]